MLQIGAASRKMVSAHFQVSLLGDDCDLWLEFAPICDGVLPGSEVDRNSQMNSVETRPEST
jgi:hypothetical protein